MSEKSDAIAAALRKAILRGDYADGEHLSQPKLALEYGIHRSVVWHALYLLEFEGFVSQDARHAYYANASYQTRQLQRVLTKLDHIEWQCGRSPVKLTGGEASLTSPGRAAILRKSQKTSSKP
jgi:DNA-binding transcriptional MocR family regulator